jgi:hypothetical protein
MKNFLWHRLARETRQTYTSTQKVYESFCTIHGHTPWPASSKSLGEFIAMRATGGAGVRQVKADTIQNNLAALRSIHVDRQLDVMVFDNPWLRQIIAGIRRVEPVAICKQATPITQSLLQDLTSPTLSSESLEDINFDTAAKVAFAGFLRMGEFTIKTSQLNDNPRTFNYTRLTRSDVTFSDDNLHVVLCLKRSKSDTEHRGVDIVLAATGSITCPVQHYGHSFAANHYVVINHYLGSMKSPFAVIG